MKSKLLLVFCAGGVTLAAHSAAADPDRQPPPSPLPDPVPTKTGPTTPDTRGPLSNPTPSSEAPAPSTTPVGSDPTTSEPVQTDPSRPPPVVTPENSPPPVVSSPPVATDTTVVTSDVPGVYAWRESRLRSGIGVGVTIGGGVSGFTDRTMRDTVSSDVSGLWDFRLSLGTHLPIGLDLTYLGTAGNVRTLTGANNGTLIGTTAEAALRFNLLPHETFTPYVFGGAGWQRYDVRDMAFATSDTGIANHDNLLEIPMGVGFSYRDRTGFTADLRGTFRAVVTDTTLVSESNGATADLHTWEASGALGWEF